jgi:hypothetical protein
MFLLLLVLGDRSIEYTVVLPGLKIPHIADHTTRPVPTRQKGAPEINARLYRHTGGGRWMRRLISSSSVGPSIDASGTGTLPLLREFPC